jgi:hypothetical protein
MLPFLTCDYHGDPKVPPTKFTVKELNIEIKVEDYPSIQDAWIAVGEAIRAKGLTSIMSSSIIDHLFMDGVLSEDDFAREYKTPEMRSFERV